jgi:formate-dependent nitrite reductase cytochrome c552 subunit
MRACLSFLALSLAAGCATYDRRSEESQVATTKQPEAQPAPSKPGEPASQSAKDTAAGRANPPVAQPPLSSTHGVPPGEALAAQGPQPSPAPEPPKPEMRAAPGGGCLGCHEGIEKMAENAAHEGLSCQDCHRGNVEGTVIAEAHRDLWANPSDYRVVGETCGNCHDDVVTASKRSLHATMAGMIGGSRYAWGAQPRAAKYATYAVKDDSKSIPEQRGAVRELAQIPSYDPAKPLAPDNSPVDDYLREQCLRCHVWSQGARQDGDWRASGCAACHVVYSDAGTYEGSDRAIDKKQKGRPRFHRLSAKIETNQCLHCHNRGGRTGVSYVGMMESDSYGSPWGTVAGKKAGVTLHGKNYNFLHADVHSEKGLACVDCHGATDLHGDGHLYQKREQAVGVRCESCHGTTTEPPTLKTASGEKLENVTTGPQGVLLLSKLDGKEHRVPQAREVVARGSEIGRSAHGIPAHGAKLACYACHSTWAPQCYGCHVQQDAGTKSGDWINNAAVADLSKAGTADGRQKTATKWQETRSYLRWESPVLGIGHRGKVTPFIPGCQVVFTQIGPDGKATTHNKVFETANGHSGISTNPIQPHTTTRAARSCADCHASTKTLGLGTGNYVTRANGVDVPFELERIVDEEGKQIQGTSRDGVRPFNRAEMDRIRRAAACIGCHQHKVDAAKWQRIADPVEWARKDPKHRVLLQHAFEGR